MTEQEGASVIYIDDHFKEHNALVVKTWGQDLHEAPSINLVYVDGKRGEDQYGAQKIHESSVSHVSNVKPAARCWKFTTE